MSMVTRSPCAAGRSTSVISANWRRVSSMRASISSSVGTGLGISICRLFVARHGHHGPDLHRRLECHRPVAAVEGELQLRLVDHVHAVVAHSFGVVPGHRFLERLSSADLGSEVRLQHTARRPARTESRNAHLAGKFAECSLDVGIEGLGVDLDGQLDARSDEPLVRVISLSPGLVCRPDCRHRPRRRNPRRSTAPKVVGVRGRSAWSSSEGSGSETGAGPMKSAGSSGVSVVFTKRGAYRRVDGALLGASRSVALPRLVRPPQQPDMDPAVQSRMLCHPWRSTSCDIPGRARTGRVRALYGYP